MKKHWMYFKYLMKHKLFVFLAGLRLKVPLWRLAVHDWSKFLPSEWIPYANYFYGMPKVGDQVYVRSMDGISGFAELIAIDRSRGTSSRRVRIHQGYIGEYQEFWAENFEIDGIDQAKEAFDAAWLKHQNRQPHHWQYWLLKLDSGETLACRMPPVFVREMLADWIGAGQAITGDGSIQRAWNWYLSNKSKIVLHPQSEAMLLKLFSDQGIDDGDHNTGIQA